MDVNKDEALLVTAQQLIDAANNRAEQADHEAKFARIDLDAERKMLREFMLDTMLLDGKRPDIQQTAETLMQFVYERMERANWDRDDDSEDPRETKERCAAWLGLRLQQAIDAALKK